MYSDALLAYVREQLAEELEAQPPTPDPIGIDRWLARSLLQKSIRRGLLEFALRAAATLLATDAGALWRSLTVIALEDLGPAGLDTTARIVAAAQDSRWRRRMGGDWKVIVTLLRQMCEGVRCQSVCDLLLRATNDLSLGGLRADMVELPFTQRLDAATTADKPLIERAVAAVLVVGALPEDGQASERCPATYFERLAEQRSTSLAAQIGWTAWRLTHNPMAALLPLLWSAFQSHEIGPAVDDDLPPIRQTGDVPLFAVDQFTRSGLAAFRAAAFRSEELRGWLERQAAARSDWSRTIGDLVFLTEGGLVTARARWPLADDLRHPMRSMPHLPYCPETVDEGCRLVRSQRRLIDDCRMASLPTARSV